MKIGFGIHGGSPSLISLLFIGILFFTVTVKFSSASPTQSLFDLENMSSAELEELARQLTSQPEPGEELESDDILQHENDQYLQLPPTHHHHHVNVNENQPSATTTDSVHVIHDCMRISMDEGVYHYKSRGRESVCGIYFVAEPDKNIVITLEYLNVDCHQNGLISIVDGWELNGEVFPSVDDHEKSLKSRFQDRCGKVGRNQEKYYSSQNAALIQYRIPGFGQGFSVRVQHVTNPKPCNILVQDTEGAFTLQNYGRNINCSLTALFDAKVRLLHMSTQQMGLKVKYSGPKSEIRHNCGKMGMQNYVQIGGSTGLETSKMHVIDEFCGHTSHPEESWKTIFCGTTTVRLVSGGKHYNSLVTEIRKADFDDIPLANYICLK